MLLKDPTGNEFSESDGMAMTKKKTLGNKKEIFLGSILDTIEELIILPAKLLVVTTTLACGFVHTLVSAVQRSGEPIDPSRCSLCHCS
jgi:hypothetical protein